MNILDIPKVIINTVTIQLSESVCVDISLLADYLQQLS